MPSRSRRRRRLAPLAIGVLATVAALVAPSAASASTTVGQLAPAQDGCQGNTIYLQTGVASGNGYTIPSDGVITSWAFEPGSSTAPGLKLKVATPALGGVRAIVGEATAGSQTPNTPTSYPTRIPVSANDVIGLMVSGTMSKNCMNGVGGSANTLDFHMGDVAPGGTATFAQATGELLSVAATVEADADHDGFGDETQDKCPGLPGSVRGCPSADLSITKSANRSNAFVGQSVTYTLTATNNGPDNAPDAVVTDALPAGATFVSATPSSGACSGTSTVTCNVGALASGAKATVSIVAAMTTPETATNTASVSSPTLVTAAQNAAGAGDPNAANNSATATTTVNPDAVVSGASQTNKKWREPARPRGIQASRTRRRIGTTFVFTLNTAAPVRLDFTQPVAGRKVRGRCEAANSRNRHRRRCTLNSIRGSVSFNGRAGQNSVNFFGWFSSMQRLKPGKYTLVVNALTPGISVIKQKLTFTIVR